MTIRPATPADLRAIHDLHLSNWRAAYRTLLPDATLEGDAARYLAGRWGRGALKRDSVFVACDGGALAGFIALLSAPEGHVYVDNLHVAPEARGRGLSRALMAMAARLAAVRPVRLTVLDGNTRARAVYAGWGGVESPAYMAEFLGILVQERQVDWPSGTALAQAVAERAP